MIRIVRSVALGIFVAVAAHAGGAFALTLGPQPTDLTPGLAVTYYYNDFGHVDEIIEFAGRKKGAIGEPWETVNARGGSGKKVFGTKFKDFVGAVITGYIRFPEAGAYSFEIRSNDGMRLTIGGEMVVEDPESHPDRDAGPVSVQISEAGWYPIEMLWFERRGSYIATLRWSQGGGMVLVPAEHLAH
jgi:hypothetical protein